MNDFWISVNNDAGIKELMEAYCGFHDSCITGISYTSGSYVDDNKSMIGCMDACGHKLVLTLNSQWKDPLALLFEGVMKFNVVGYEENYFCEILGAYLSFCTDLTGKTRDDKLIVWSNNECFKPESYSEEKIISANGKNSTYIVAQKLSWRFMKPEE